MQRKDENPCRRIRTAGRRESCEEFEKADERRTFEKGHLDAIGVGDVVFGRAVFEPGWKWSECVKPIAGTDVVYEFSPAAANYAKPAE